MSFIHRGYWRKILHIDLTDGRIYNEDISENILNLFIGGKGFAYYFMYKNIPKKINPFSVRNTLLFVPGAFSGIVPGSSKLAVAGKSPLTGLLTDSYSGDYFGPFLKKAGFDALIIHGKSEYPVYLWIYDGEVELRNAESIWGLNVSEVVKKLRDENGENISIACIGPAGENLVRYANIIFDTERAAGRGGLGAVMGSKRLKAIAVYGSKNIPVAEPEELKEFNDKYYERFLKSYETEELRRYGTTQGLIRSSQISMSPSYNFSRPWISEDLAKKLSGDEIIKKEVSQDEVPWYIHGDKCPIKCSRYVKTSYKGRIFYVKPEYESLAMLGAATGTFDLDAVLYFIRLVDDLGLDSIGTGNTIAWFLELIENEMISKDDLLNIVEIKGFGDKDSIEKLIQSIAYRKGIGAILAEGVKRASEILGRGEDIAVHVKGLEAPAWDPRGLRGYALSYATSDIGASHLRGWPSPHEPPSSGPAKDKVKSIIKDRDYKALIDSLGICLFNPYNSRDIASMYELITGVKRSFSELTLVSKRVESLSRIYATLEGITPEDDKIPLRWMKPIPEGPLKGVKAFLDEDDMRSAIKTFYRLRGWHEELGVPLPETLKNLGLEWVISDAIEALKEAASRLNISVSIEYHDEP